MSPDLFDDQVPLARARPRLGLVLRRMVTVFVISHAKPAEPAEPDQTEHGTGRVGRCTAPAAAGGAGAS